MSELKPISPLLDGMEMIRCLADNGASRLYLLRHANGEAFILKQLLIPESQTQVEALLITGAAANEEEAQRYYEQRVADYEDSLKALAPLRGSSNCATYLGYQVCAREEGVGFELSLLSERYVTLPAYLNENAMTHLRALNLGLDLCTALCELRSQNLIHRDIKPENIYLNAMGGFMIGDLGAVRISQLKFCTMPDRMVSAYTAPEIADAMGEFNTTVDIYSVGMVLYRILNGNHGPFEDENTSAAAANKLRLTGEPLPSPLYADYELAAIVMKACAFEPSDRFQNPDELLQELILYMKRNNVSDTLIVPPLNAGEDMLVPLDSMDEPVEPVRFAEVEAMDEKFVDSFSPTMEIPEVAEPEEEEELSEPGGMGAQPVFAAPHTRHADDEDEPPIRPEEKPKKSKKLKKAKKKNLIAIPIVIAVLLLAVIGLAGWYLLMGGPAVALNGLTITGRGVEWLEVDVDVGEQEGLELNLICTDPYGNAMQQRWTGRPVTIKGLTSGTQYTITAHAVDGQLRVTGKTTVSAATAAATEIVDFSAASAGNGQAELKLTVSGPAPETWTVRYSVEGGEEQEVSFSGETVSIFNLEPDKRYTFTLVPPEGTVLEGNATAELITDPSLQIFDLKAEAVSGSVVRATWTSEGNAPSEWSVTCTGPDNSSKTQFVKSCAAEFSQLSSGETYTISVTAPGVSSPAETTVTPLAAEIQSMRAEAQGADGLRVVWESDQPNGEWLLRYGPKGSDDVETMQATGSEVSLTGLAPGATYEFELRSSRDEPLGDAAKTEGTLPAPADFNSYGADRFFMGTFALPEKANWTRMDLNPGVSEFQPGKGLAFAVDSFSGHDDSDDEVKVTIVVEDNDGVPVIVKNYTDTWDGLWASGVITGSVETLPGEPGEYVVRLYFNSQLAVSKGITVLSE